MNDLQKELQALKEKVAELESRILFPNEPVAKWKPKGGCYYVTMDGEIDEDGVDEDDEDVGVSFGVRRKPQAQAERASIEMRRFNRLLALRDELCGDELVAWVDDYTEKYHIYFSHERGRWYITPDIFCESITPYFTSDELAQKACDMLNSGEVEL
jgi:hypothetical protein